MRGGKSGGEKSGAVKPLLSKCVGEKIRVLSFISTNFVGSPFALLRFAIDNCDISRKLLLKAGAKYRYVTPMSLSLTLFFSLYTFQRRDSHTFCKYSPMSSFTWMSLVMNNSVCCSSLLEPTFGYSCCARVFESLLEVELRGSSKHNNI